MLIYILSSQAFLGIEPMTCHALLFDLEESLIIKMYENCIKTYETLLVFMLLRKPLHSQNYFVLLFKVGNKIEL